MMKKRLLACLLLIFCFIVLPSGVLAKEKTLRVKIPAELRGINHLDVTGACADAGGTCTGATCSVGGDICVNLGDDDLALVIGTTAGSSKFIYVTASTDADDDDAVFKPTSVASGPGRWHWAGETITEDERAKVALIDITQAVDLDALESAANAAYSHSQIAHAPSDAEANVQADWNEADSGSDAYIANKPTLGTASDNAEGDFEPADSTILKDADIGSTVQADLDVPTQAEAEAGTETIERAFTAQRVAQAIFALAPGGVDEIIYQADCSSITNGICIDTDDGNIYYYNGSAVVEFTGGGTYDSADFDADFATKSTTDLSEGANFYYTEARVSANADVTANTAKNSYPSADAAKVGFLTVTGAVNLDSLAQLYSNYLSGIDQQLSTTSSPTFAGLTINGGLTVNADDGDRAVSLLNNTVTVDCVVGDYRLYPQNGVWTQCKDGTASALFDGAYSSLSGLPTLGTVADNAEEDFEPAGAITTHAGAADPHGDRAYADSQISDLSLPSFTVDDLITLGLVFHFRGDSAVCDTNNSSHADAMSTLSGYGITSTYILCDYIPGIDVTLSGTGLAAGLGTMSVDVNETLNVALTGIGATVGLGTLDVHAEWELAMSGLGLTTATGTVSVTVVNGQEIVLTGISATAGLGTITIKQDHNFTLAGVAMAVGLGTVVVDTGAPPAAPDPPTGMSVESVNYGTIGMHPGTSAGATSYKYYRTDNGSTPSKGNYAATGTVTDRQVQTGLSTGTNYKYVFTAVASGQESAESSVVSVTPTAALVNANFTSGTWYANSITASSDISVVYDATKASNVLKILPTSSAGVSFNIPTQSRANNGLHISFDMLGSKQSSGSTAGSWGYVMLLNGTTQTYAAVHNQNYSGSGTIWQRLPGYPIMYTATGTQYAWQHIDLYVTETGFDHIQLSHESVARYNAVESTYTTFDKLSIMSTQAGYPIYIDNILVEEYWEEEF